ncbi:CLUMA_CG019257, isoform A [Clunio marinus]|uniref:CLUMA_CG019257, isoform A n=1 Tax=Clunio marinus TaxID=568069 RepID=A0A1J1J3Z9_9DIPT|nr:CLUMA_CG019257, isoform A [Clunio marinus]
MLNFPSLTPSNFQTHRPIELTLSTRLKNKNKKGMKTPRFLQHENFTNQSKVENEQTYHHTTLHYKIL